MLNLFAVRSRPSFIVSAFSKKRVSAYVANPVNLIITVAIVAMLLLYVIPFFVRWGITEAVWYGSAQACQAAEGACWAFIRAKYHFFIFGGFPLSEVWRANAALLTLFVTSLGISGYIGIAPRRQIIAWVAGTAISLWLVLGGWGLSAIRFDEIGGLLLTMLLAVASLPLAFILGIGLALARTSSLPLLRIIATAFIEFLRCAPLITLLIVAYVALPLFLPGSFRPPKLVWAYVVFFLTASTFMAEAIRSGMQAIPDTQIMAANSLGFSRAYVLKLVLLPQALRHAIPGLANAFVSFFKNTSMVSVIGVTDFLGAIKSGSHDMEWGGREVEGYLFAILVYFVLCSVIALIARAMEKQYHTF
jgi:general L-amino acid transport system permease protein